jgi:hypothetical protein
MRNNMIIMRDDLEQTWKKVYFKVISYHVSGTTEENN